MDAIEERIAEAERDLRQARRILSVGGSYQPEEWLLLATLVGQADLALREASQSIPRLHVPLFDLVMEEFRQATSDFTDARFLRASRAARRRNPQLFSPSH